MRPTRKTVKRTRSLLVCPFSTRRPRANAEFWGQGHGGTEGLRAYSPLIEAWKSPKLRPFEMKARLHRNFNEVNVKIKPIKYKGLCHKEIGG